MDLSVVTADLEACFWTWAVPTWNLRKAWSLAFFCYFLFVSWFLLVEALWVVLPIQRRLPLSKYQFIGAFWSSFSMTMCIWKWYKSVSSSGKDIICLWVSTLHVASSYQQCCYQHWTPASRKSLRKCSLGCFNYVKFDILKLQYELRLPQNTGNQFIRWENTIRVCLKYYCVFSGKVLHCFNRTCWS